MQDMGDIGGQGFHIEDCGLVDHYRDIHRFPR